MRQTKAIVLLSLYLLVNTELHQILSLPVLFEHFHEHQQKTKGISILSFLRMHYSGEKKGSDDGHHQQLPFKGKHCEEVATSMFLPADNLSSSIDSAIIPPKKTTVYKSPFNSSAFHFTIWQPPRA
ncbi:MAG TPA: hypothetical protein VFW11_13695 [Cyclobacteriaceae bacterium]|nr:hypothetical protein [Cyclobacteriaceae bacterium]